MKPSLKGRLRWLIVLVIVTVLIPLAVLGYHRALQEMNELADGRLAQAARTVDTLVESSHIGEALRHPVPSSMASPRSQIPLVVPVRGQNCSTQGESCEPEVGFQVANTAGVLLVETENLSRFPWTKHQEAGFHDVTVRGERWRTYTIAASANGDRIRVAERYGSRDEIAQMLRLEHGLSLLIVLPLLAVLVGWAVQRGLRPLERLAEQLLGRSPGSREPITLAAAPIELQPVLIALNDLLNRSEDALEREHQFAADAAHELRTPLAGAIIHLENARTADAPPDIATSLASARSGLERLARRIEQLLALARLEAGAASDEKHVVDLAVLAADVIDELTPLLESRDADLSLICDLTPEPDRVPEHYLMKGHSAALSALFRNLIENALRHTPPKGTIDIRLSRDLYHLYLDVIDNGPGIPQSRREAVFARFHREPGGNESGHGLGLSIVMRAAELHDATVELLDAPTYPGLRVRVSFPASEVTCT